MTFPSRLSLAVAVSAALFIAGCSVQQTGPSVDRPLTEMEQVTQLLNEAETAAPIRSAELKADAARILMRLGRKDDAARLLDEIDLQRLAPALQFEIAQLKARTALEKEDGRQALKYLQQLPESTTNALPAEQQYTIGELQADAYRYQQDRLSELLQLIQLSSYSPESKTQALHNRIWDILNELPSAQLQQLSRQPANSYYEQGWYELILSTRGATDLSSQSKQMEQWQLLWESHPAQRVAPEALQAITQASTIEANRIGLLLPLSGRLQKPAEAILNGFMTAHYNAVRDGRATPEIIVLDTEQFMTPAQLYQAATDKQLDLLIGPLRKEIVEKTLDAGPAPIPTLTLNTLPEKYQSNIYQFGLAVEDEAIQAAEQMWLDGHKQALVYTASAEWGQRAETAFAKHFEALGGTILDSYSFANDANYSEQIATLLATEASTERRKQLTRIIGERPESEERRRQDVDAIFLSALPQAARQIKPTLAFHYAGRVPVYSTSHIYTGTESAIEDQDLNGIRFVATPWLIGQPSNAHLQLAQQQTNTNSRFGRLYALGVDAFELYPYLAQLAASPEARINGETGTLSINDSNQIQRQLRWAIFKQGVATAQ